MAEKVLVAIVHFICLELLFFFFSKSIILVDFQMNRQDDLAVRNAGSRCPSLNPGSKPYWLYDIDQVTYLPLHVSTFLSIKCE